MSFVSHRFTGVGLLASSLASLASCSSGAPEANDQTAGAGGRNTAGQAGAMANAGAGASGGAVASGGAGGLGVAGGGHAAGGTAAAGNAGAGTGGSSETGGAGGATAGSGGVTSGGGGSVGGAPILAVCPNCVSVFDGTTLNGWTQVPPSSWSVVDGAMHSLGAARGFIYTSNSYGDFRFIFTSRLVKDPQNHLPCVLFWGNSPNKDALQAIQIQPPNGWMWDYRATGPTSNQSPDRYEQRFDHPGFVDTQWSQCEMLGNRAAGKLRFACCQVTGTGPCKASEVVDFTDPTAGLKAPLALQVHNARMIEEFKDVYVESPVADPSTLVTTK